METAKVVLDATGAQKSLPPLDAACEISGAGVLRTVPKRADPKRARVKQPPRTFSAPGHRAQGCKKPAGIRIFRSLFEQLDFHLVHQSRELHLLLVSATVCLTFTKPAITPSYSFLPSTAKTSFAQVNF